MNPTIETFVAALNDFADAAETLAEEWERASEEVGDSCNEGYPFPNSFDEVAHGIRLWVEEARKSLANAA